MELYVLYGILTFITVWDLRTFRIPNGFVIGAGLTGLLTSFFLNSWSGLASGLLNLSIALVAFVIIWMGLELVNMPAIGAGDIKLLAAISSFSTLFNTTDIFSIAFISVLIGALLFLIILLFRNPSSIKAMFDRLIHLFIYAIPNEPMPENQQQKLAFSIPIFLSVLYHLHL
ncbi:prepilin peptidase (plasmid) [Pontibacillus sp. ALD_SL1]|uniref:prepilin peptidase n=1 Tax=Pontibacillus sp. ALD_SL1 TaxID=2777185 RepID=UPI001A963715|nr:A24 family peptidase [Pontibacillus sp. ALD_SL1]QST02976.1 prepilin peptidase [Pontibacillus sp. ALD_SL1]